ncbi:MAG: DUF2252 family protein [Alphaproteobacteria bacterium]
MDFAAATRDYERWMKRQLAANGLAADAGDLRDKHRTMAKKKRKHAFGFLRATYYRWAQLWPEICAGEAEAPRVLAVGDLHLENFGTWRDAEGRLCWGINDFDEAWRLPYTNDLVRLAASALLAERASRKFNAAPAAIARAILAGYAAGLASGPKPFVLEERHAALRAMAYFGEKEPAKFWAGIDEDSRQRKAPARVRKLLAAAMPERGLAIEFLHREGAGLGSLGRPRHLARAQWRGGLVAHEAKALVPSAAAWSEGARAPRSRARDLLDAVTRAGRCRDPYLRFREGWVVRRLAPRSSKIEIGSLPPRADPLDLLEQMGRELANVHLAEPRAAAAIARDLARRKRGWLEAAARRMAAQVVADWKAWRARHG